MELHRLGRGWLAPAAARYRTGYAVRAHPHDSYIKKAKGILFVSARAKRAEVRESCEVRSPARLSKAGPGPGDISPRVFRAPGAHPHRPSPFPGELAALKCALSRLREGGVCDRMNFTNFCCFARFNIIN